MPEKFRENLEEIPVEEVKQEQSQPENREKRAEVLLRFLDIAKKIEPLHGKKFEEIFDSEEHKRAFFDSLTSEEFIQLLNGINGILRDKKKEEWEMDGEQVILKSEFTGLVYVPPEHEDKPELLAEVLSAAKKMNKEKRDLKDIALLLSSSLNAIHPYRDANGRTSRLIYLLTTKNITPESKQELREILSDYGRNKVDIDPVHIGAYLENLIEKEIGITDPEINKDNITDLFDKTKTLHKKEEDLRKKPTEENKDLLSFLEKMELDYRRILCSVFKFLRDNPEFYKDKYLNKFPKRTALLIDYLLKDLNSEQLKEILENYRELKKEYIKKLIDCIVHPDKEEYKIEHQGKNIPLKEYFEEKIKEKQEEIAEEMRRYQEEQEAKIREQKRLEEKEKSLQERFNSGEGEYRTFEVEEVNLMRKILGGITKKMEEEKEFKREGKDYTDDEKVQLLKDVLLKIAIKLKGEEIKKEIIDAYVEDRKAELLGSWMEYHAVERIMDYLDSSGAFEYRFTTSNIDEYDEKEGLPIKDLLSQSVYYVNKDNMSLRLKLFDVSSGVKKVIQPLMEHIFYTKEMVDFRGKKVVKVERDQKPELRKNIFEIATPDFKKMMQGKRDKKKPFKSGVRTISDEEGIYINIPPKSTVHSGWKIISIKDLKQQGS